MIYKISPFPSLLKRGKKAEMVRSIMQRADILKLVLFRTFGF